MNYLVATTGCIFFLAIDIKSVLMVKNMKRHLQMMSYDSLFTEPVQCRHLINCLN